jgi:ribosomal protein L37AE/L43A
MSVKTAELVRRLRKIYPDFKFYRAKKSKWSPGGKTIFYGADPAELFHELAHATLGHAHAGSDVERLKMERAAWTDAKKIAAEFGVEITNDDVEDHIDSYRLWLHRRSLCPSCHYTGVEDLKTHKYRCIMCGNTWDKT